VAAQTALECYLVVWARTRRPQARELHQLAIRYACSAWLRERDAVNPPPTHEGTRLQWLWSAFKAGATMPLGERQLRHVLGS
jgi:hypothetical protein